MSLHISSSWLWTIPLECSRHTSVPSSNQTFVKRLADLNSTFCPTSPDSPWWRTKSGKVLIKRRNYLCSPQGNRVFATRVIRVIPLWALRLQPRYTFSRFTRKLCTCISVFFVGRPKILKSCFSWSDAEVLCKATTPLSLPGQHRLLYHSHRPEIRTRPAGTIEITTLPYADINYEYLSLVGKRATRLGRSSNRIMMLRL